MGSTVFSEEAAVKSRVEHTPENPVVMKHGPREKSTSMLTFQRRRQDLIAKHAVLMEEVRARSVVI